MDPVTHAAVVVLKEGLKVAIKKGIKAAADYRVERFYEAFVRAYAEEKELGVESSELDELLKKLETSERGQETLFDAQRRVFMSASRELGPRVIAYLAAELAAQDRWAEDWEEQIYLATQQLHDRELRKFAQEFKNAFARSQLPDDPAPSGRFIYLKKKASRDDGSLLPPSISDAIQERGPWTVKLRNIGILDELVRDEDFPGSTHVSAAAPPGQMVVTGRSRSRVYCLIVNERFKKFSELIDRAVGPASEGDA